MTGFLTHASLLSSAAGIRRTCTVERRSGKFKKDIPKTTAR
jgi:hypothetical protein